MAHINDVFLPPTNNNDNRSSKDIFRIDSNISWAMTHLDPKNRALTTNDVSTAHDWLTNAAQVASQSNAISSMLSNRWDAHNGDIFLRVEDGIATLADLYRALLLTSRLLLEMSEPRKDGGRSTRDALIRTQQRSETLLRALELRSPPQERPLCAKADEGSKGLCGRLPKPRHEVLRECLSMLQDIEYNEEEGSIDMGGRECNSSSSAAATLCETDIAKKFDENDKIEDNACGNDDEKINDGECIFLNDIDRRALIMEESTLMEIALLTPDDNRFRKRKIDISAKVGVKNTRQKTNVISNKDSLLVPSTTLGMEQEQKNPWLQMGGQLLLVESSFVPPTNRDDDGKEKHDNEPKDPQTKLNAMRQPVPCNVKLYHGGFLVVEAMDNIMQKSEKKAQLMPKKLNSRQYYHLGLAFRCQPFKNEENLRQFHFELTGMELIHPPTDNGNHKNANKVTSDTRLVFRVAQSSSKGEDNIDTGDGGLIIGCSWTSALTKSASTAAAIDKISNDIKKWKCSQQSE